MPHDPILVLDKVSKLYANGFQALDNVSFEINRGDFFALLGPNGAGKSTLINILTSLTNRSSGNITMFGQPFHPTAYALKQMVGVVPQEQNLNIFESCLNTLLTNAQYYGLTRQAALPRCEHWLKKFNLWHKRHDRIVNLSGGMKTRLMVVRALVHGPELLFLDEPTAGIDVEMRHEMWDILRDVNDSGVTIILTTHYLEEAEKLCRTLAIIHSGKVIQQGDVSTALASLRDETFRVHLHDDIEQTTIKTPDFTLSKAAPKCFDVTMQQPLSHHQLTTQLMAAGHTVDRIYPHANRLESLFMKLISRESS